MIDSSKLAEIVECKLFKRNQLGERIGHEQWYIGGIERGTRRCFTAPAQNRNAETMTKITTDNVHEGTLIITDMCRAYARVSTNYSE